MIKNLNHLNPKNKFIMIICLSMLDHFIHLNLKHIIIVNIIIYKRMIIYYISHLMIIYKIIIYLIYYEMIKIY